MAIFVGLGRDLIGRPPAYDPGQAINHDDEVRFPLRQGTVGGGPLPRRGMVHSVSRNDNQASTFLAFFLPSVAFSQASDFRRDVFANTFRDAVSVSELRR
jgi:hypothetical protein